MNMFIECKFVFKITVILLKFYPYLKGKNENFAEMKNHSVRRSCCKAENKLK